MPGKKEKALEQTQPLASVQFEASPDNGGPGGDVEVRHTRQAPMLGQEELYITGGKPMGFNVPKELMHGSDNPVEYLARTEVSEDEIGNYVRVQGLMMAFTFGLVDLDHVFKSKFNLRMSLSRKSREETVEVAKAEKKFASRMQDRFMGNQGAGNGRLGGGGNL